MPRQRPPKALWRELRVEIWERDGRRCRHCGVVVSLQECHIDHVHSGKTAGNGRGNLRTLCRRCHVLRADPRHRGMTARSIERGVIPPDWRSLVWRDY
jgi:5-methylcytosine-specific restriction endonuclease McrA